jgi:uncharacterized protein (DUF433 family)
MTIHQDSVPLRIDEADAIRVGNTRVLFVLVVFAYKRGATAEQIVEMYTSLDLADVYAVIAYYLRHRDEVEHYLEEWDAAGDRIREQWEAKRGQQPNLREIMTARWQEWKKNHASAGD